MQPYAATLPRAMPGVPHAHAARYTRQDALQALMPQRERAQRARVLTSARSALRFATRLAVSSATRSAMRFATCNRHAHYHHPLPTALRLSTHPPPYQLNRRATPLCAQMNRDDYDDGARRREGMTLRTTWATDVKRLG